MFLACLEGQGGSELIMPPLSSAPALGGPSSWGPKATWQLPSWLAYTWTAFLNPRLPPPAELTAEQAALPMVVGFMASSLPCPGQGVMRNSRSEHPKSLQSAHLDLHVFTGPNLLSGQPHSAAPRPTHTSLSWSFHRRVWAEACALL